jgi:hypothetical protein
LPAAETALRNFVPAQDANKTHTQSNTKDSLPVEATSTDTRFFSKFQLAARRHNDALAEQSKAVAQGAILKKGVCSKPTRVTLAKPTCGEANAFQLGTLIKRAPLVGAAKF